MACEMDMKKRVLDEMYRMLSRNKERDAYRYDEFSEELEDLVHDIVLALAEEKKELSDEDIEDEIVEQLNWIRLQNGGWRRKDQNYILIGYGVDDALELLDESGLESECWRLETMVEAIMHRYLDRLDWRVLVDLAKHEPKKEMVEPVKLKKRPTLKKKEVVE